MTDDFPRPDNGSKDSTDRFRKIINQPNTEPEQSDGLEIPEGVELPLEIDPGSTKWADQDDETSREELITGDTPKSLGQPGQRNENKQSENAGLNFNQLDANGRQHNNGRSSPVGG